MEISTAKVPKEKVAGFYSALGELHAYERKPVLGKCMFWSDRCPASPIASHLLSRVWLEQIADGSNHVVQFRLAMNDCANKPPRLEAHPVGINEATTFPGFCEQHDNDLFSCLEKQAFAATRAQLLALAYVVRFAKQPTVLVSTTINPLVTFTGRLLDSRWDWLTASIIPSSGGGWAVFTWSKSAPKNPSLFTKSFANIAKESKTAALLNFVLESSNQFAMSPEWWESLSPERQNDLIRRFGRSFQRGLGRPAANTLLPPKTAWLDWQPVEARYV